MSDIARKKNRNTELGDRACFCVECGWARRFYPGVIEPPETCPACSGTVISACPACGESILSIMAVDCDVCGERMRSPEIMGIQIRRSPRRERVAAAPLAGDEVQQADAGCSDDGSCGCAG